jgi:hypothetical protein
MVSSATVVPLRVTGAQQTLIYFRPVQTECVQGDA